MMMTQDRLKGITPFVASVEQGSFTAAAAVLHLTSSAISKSVATAGSAIRFAAV